jgi:hypothetical protein
LIIDVGDRLRKPRPIAVPVDLLADPPVEHVVRVDHLAGYVSLVVLEHHPREPVAVVPLQLHHVVVDRVRAGTAKVEECS